MYIIHEPNDPSQGEDGRSKQVVVWQKVCNYVHWATSKTEVAAMTSQIAMQFTGTMSKVEMLKKAPPCTNWPHRIEPF